MRFNEGDWVLVEAGREAGGVGQIVRIAHQQVSYSGGIEPDHVSRSYFVELRLPGNVRRTVTVDEVQLRVAADHEIVGS